MIKQLKPNKSPGPDDIGNKLIVNSPESFSRPLNMIFNKSIEEGIYPSDLKIGKVIAIFKKGHHYLTENYRPISLLSSFNKIFEKLLHKRLISFLEKHKLLFIHQYGFRKLHSTTLALIEITDKLKENIDIGNYAMGIFLDLTKAFDTVDHDILLQKLNSYGIRGHSNDFFRSYLTNREQFTFINKKKSTTKSINFGVPQGSVLGPLFFILYINDIQFAIPNSHNIRLFADDAGIFLYNRNLDMLVTECENVLKSIYCWFQDNRLTLNQKKIIFLYFSCKK